MTLKLWLALIFIAISRIASAQTTEPTLPDFAVVKPIAQSLANHQWSYVPSSHMDTYRYTTTRGNTEAGIIIRVGNDLPSLYALAQQHVSVQHATKESVEVSLSGNAQKWIEYRCQCHGDGVQITLATMVKTSLQHLSKDIWMHITATGTEQELATYKQWLNEFTLVLN